MTIMKLIDKYILVAEIKELIRANELYLSETNTNEIRFQKVGAYSVLNDLLHFIDNLEAKEVDLAKEIDKFYGMYRKNGITFSIEDNQECLDWKEDCNPDFEIGFAKHFFELGLKAKQESNDEVKVGETQIYFNDSREQPYVGKGLDLSCMKYETLKTLFKDGDNVEILIRKA